MKDFRNTKGATVELEYRLQRVYGMSAEPATKEEFLSSLPACRNTDEIVNLCDTLETNSVFEVVNLTVDKGESIPASSYAVISTYFETFFISQGDGSYTGKVIVKVDGREIVSFTNMVSVTSLR